MFVPFAVHRPTLVLKFAAVSVLVASLSPVMDAAANRPLVIAPGGSVVAM